ncbi:MAG: zinc ribbon domain-containing protein [Blastocatellia bacterium]|nr:zinc ribbon domain-containing protein [Blastocatellia bacterium]
MQQPCSRCGYISDRPARFCRQCGVQLAAESETTSAVTQNYEPRRTGGSAPEQPRPYASPVQDYPPETARFYQPPAPGQAYSQQPIYPNYSVPPPRKSSAGPWLVVLFLAVLLMGGGMIGIVGYFAKSRNPRTIPVTADQIAEDERQRIQDEIEQAMQEARQAIEEAKQEAAAAAEEGAAPPAPPPPPAPGDNGMPAGLEKYRYEKADLIDTSSFLGNDVVNMQTSDNIEKVHDFYKKLAGNPILSTKGQDGQKYIFQVPASPPIVIILNPANDDPDLTSIQIARSKLVPNLK